MASHSVAYSKSGKKLRKNSKGKWVTSKGSRAKAYSYSKPTKKKGHKKKHRRHRRKKST